ncbi:putative nucleotidyltransferase substrate binding domain-containing protein [Pseudothauera rhizosphaerae]|uniref:CBS domain-containing protein n=1 Tax=Pseudothauera rhizosphaerae TaxID=2565932 RepID=A0A4S4AWK6_9RHOO|nr:putative nucleotidyltransferase substrate binding domain-containing protein [Pseudothauera rhizosphaerae]THF64277.1 CBS domain-containing protein [Pseudothauera rhizosphaerae]
MAAENVFFIPVGALCRREVATCAADQALVEAAATMRERGISSVIACDADGPVGIVTDRDLRNKVVAQGLDPHGLRVADVMNSPLVTIGEDEYLFEALFLMSRHRIHRLCVVDADGKLSGILTDSDVLRLQSRSPQQLMLEIEEAASAETLKTLHRKVEELVVHLVGTGIETRDLVQTVAHLNDRILARLIELVRAERYPDLTRRFAFVVLGSEGRGEQTLVTDQDNAIIHADDLTPAELDRLREFSVDLIDTLIGIGVPPCPGGIMAKNDIWRRSLGEWKEVLDRWLRTPTPDNIMSGSMFFDLRTLHGHADYERELKRYITAQLRANDLFLARSAANVVKFRPPLGWFGRIVAEKQGPHRGTMDVKKAGIFAITEGVKAMALRAGIVDGGTRDRILGLCEAGVLDSQQAENIVAAFDFLVGLRLRAQLLALEEGREPSNHLPLDHLNRIEKGRLRLALEEVQTFQTFLRNRFQLAQLGG